MSDFIKQQLVESNIPAVMNAVEEHQKGVNTPEGGHPKLVGFALPAAVSLDLVAGAVKFAVDLAATHFGPALDTLAQTQKALVDKFISDAALEAIANGIRHMESNPKPAS